MTRRILCLILLIALAIPFAMPQTSSAAPPASNPGQDRLNQMIADGWKPVANGVLKRNTGGNQVETFAMGVEGFTFAYEELRSQYGFLLSEFRKHHDPNVRKALVDVNQQMVRTQSDIQALQTSTLAAPPAAGCDFSYGAHANAYATTSVQGVQADASAYFNNNCGYSGDTYAYAYARAAIGTVTTTKTQTDPKTGANISSAATAAVAGSLDCYSYATARASSVDLGISYSTASENFSCPVVNPPPIVTVSGLSSTSIFGYTCKTVTWTSTVTSGTTPYVSYAWYENGYLVGNGGTSYSETFCGDDYTWTQTVNMSLTVTDSAGKTGTGAKTTYIYYTGSGGGGGCLQMYPGSEDPSIQILPCLY
jgi:hypothetical protein